MDRQTALDIWAELEKHASAYEGDTAPTYDVRLDAGHDRATDSRTYRLRVSTGPWPLNAGDLINVLELAADRDCDVTLDNAAVTIT